jgi:adenylate cyclase
MSAKKVRFPIGLKLVLIISLLIGASLSVITVLVSYLVGSDVRLTAENNNWTMNRWSAAAAENILHGVKSRALLLIRNIDGFVGEDSPAVYLDEIASRFYRLNPDIACVAFVGQDDGSSGIFTNDLFGPAPAFSGEGVSSWLDGRGDLLGRAAGGETLLLNGYPGFNIPFLVMLFPLPPSPGFAFSGAAAVFFSAEELAALLRGNTAGGNSTFMVNGEGDALIYGEEGLVRSGENLKRLSIVRQAMEGGISNLQALYTDQNGAEYFGAFRRIPGAGAIVLTGVESRIVFEGINSAIRRIIMISGSVLALSVIYMLVYSRSISGPLKVLTNAAEEIERGNYQPPLEAKSRDEIGDLTKSFISMGRGLVNFERFTGKSIVSLARKGKLELKGEDKTVTVCFIFIRNFDEISKGMGSKKLVAFINSFLKHAVLPCITKTGGFVDKYLTQSGVVVMALWGAVEDAGFAAETSPAAKQNPAEEDAKNCIRSALMMRGALRKFNRKRQAGGGRVPVRLGCGINTGEVTVGPVGSGKRMEYTVIGDAVNLASRIEEPNNELDTDILITENTWKLCGRRLVTKEMGRLEVKGKTGFQRVFSVINMRNRPGPETMEDVRRLWLA